MTIITATAFFHKNNLSFKKIAANKAKSILDFNLNNNFSENTIHIAIKISKLPQLEVPIIVALLTSKVFIAFRLATVVSPHNKVATK